MPSYALRMQPVRSLVLDFPSIDNGTDGKLRVCERVSASAQFLWNQFVLKYILVVHVGSISNTIHWMNIWQNSWIYSIIIVVAVNLPLHTVILLTQAIMRKKEKKNDRNFYLTQLGNSYSMFVISSIKMRVFLCDWYAFYTHVACTLYTYGTGNRFQFTQKIHTHASQNRNRIRHSSRLRYIRIYYYCTRSNERCAVVVDWAHSYFVHNMCIFKIRV